MSGKRAVVVGGGVVGGFCAYELAKAGFAVTVVERGRFGGACSHGNCGYVCPSHVLPLAGPGAVFGTLGTLFRRNSPLKVRPAEVLLNFPWFHRFASLGNRREQLRAANALHALLHSSRRLYDDFLEAESPQVEWESRGLLFVFESRKPFEHYAEVDHFLRHRFGVGADRFAGDELNTLEPSLRGGLAGGYLYRSDAHLRPDRLMAELRRVLTNRGVTILEGREVTGVDGRGDAVAVWAGGEAIPADAVVVATGAWAPQLARALGCRVPVLPGKGYSLTYDAQPDGPTYPMIFEEHRVAVTPFAGGFRVGSTMEFAGYDERLREERLGLLTAGAARYLRNPPAGPPREAWAGLRPMTPDGLPRVGRAPAWRNVYLAAGHGMLGVSTAPATGRLIAELVAGRAPHVDAAPYAPRPA